MGAGGRRGQHWNAYSIGPDRQNAANVEAEETPLQRRLDQLGKTLSIGALILVAVVFVLELIDATDISSLFSGRWSTFKPMQKKLPMCLSSR